MFGVLLVAAIALGSGCATAGGEAVPDRQSTTDSSVTLPSKLVLTLRDHGRTIRVARTRRLVLVLGGRYRWNDPTSGGAIHASEIVSDAPSGAQMWDLRALRTGVATLRSRGTPACRPTAAGCPKTARRVVVRLDVRR